MGMRRGVGVATAALLVTAAAAAGFTSAEAATTTDTYFTSTQRPAAALDADRTGVEVGMKFTVKIAGKVTAVRFYKGGAANTGPHTGSVWSSTGTRLARVTFAGESPSGWQQAVLASPLAVSPGRTYVVSYFAPAGRYSASNDYFTAPRTVGPISTPADAGVYRYGRASGFPTSTYRASNYWVDVRLATETATPSPPATAPPTSTPTTPPAGVLDLPVEQGWIDTGSYYKRWAKADTAGWDDPSFFPISVFFGKPSHADALKSVGINTYMGAEHDGSTMSTITSKGIHVLAQGEWTRAEVGDDPQVVSWHVSDECEMGYSGCLDSNNETQRLAVQKQMADRFRAYNDGRFLQANFGNGVLRTWWAPNTMDDHVKLMDTVSVDKYAYTSPHVQDIIPNSPDWPAGADPKRAATYGWLQDQMEKFQEPGNPRPNWVFVEAAKPYLTESGATTITVPQIEGAVWSSIIHGARGIAYFQHNNNGACGNYALVDCSQALKDGVKALNTKVQSLAPVINSPTYVWDFQAAVDTMLKVRAGSVYVFAGVGLKDSPGSKAFTLPAGVKGDRVEVVGEGRTLTVSGGKFTDTFAAESSTHVYRIAQ